MPQKGIKVRYSREDFLKYYKFKDEPEKIPTIFHVRYKSYENILKGVREDVKRGMRIIPAIVKNAEVAKDTAQQWKADCLKELRDGKTDTPLIRLFTQAGIGDAHLESQLAELSMKMAEEGDSKMVQFLMKHRLGYTEKKEVEVAANDDFNFNIQIVDSKKEED